MELLTRVLKNQYHDSVVLMRAARALKQEPQVEDAAYMMGTEANKDLLKQGELLDSTSQSARPNDLIIAVRAEDASPEILDFAEELLSGHRPSEKTENGGPKTLRSVVRAHPEANIAVISVAGAYAAREAREALVGGLNVLLFSDNISLEDELGLKRLAVQRGLLLMGPGAGTAILNGVGFGFANQVPDGEIGIVSAAGTGLQEVSTLLARENLGISQAIGTGGRDLSQSIGGLMFFASLDALGADPQTKLIILISKPPDPQIAAELFARAGRVQKPVVLCLLGADRPKSMGDNLHFTRTLEECGLTAQVIYTKSPEKITERITATYGQLHQKADKLKVSLSPNRKYLRALYSGGTLCYESQVIWQEILKEPVLSNAPLDQQNHLPDAACSQGHTAVDLGEEEFTLGRPHPMIDNELRIQRMAQEAADPQTAVILLDVVLGYGVHPDPAGELSDAIQAIQVDHPEVFWVCSVTGTEADPQVRSQSIAKLEEAGVIVCGSNAQAARLAARLVQE